MDTTLLKKPFFDEKSSKKSFVLRGIPSTTLQELQTLGGF
jgi:hypothetical protein